MTGRGFGGGGIVFLGGGAIAGIVVGSIVGAFVLAALVYWFIARPLLEARRRRQGDFSGREGRRPWPSFFDGVHVPAVKDRKWPSFYDRTRPDRTRPSREDEKV